MAPLASSSSPRYTVLSSETPLSAASVSLEVHEGVGCIRDLMHR
jgi:hypothetical protein